MKRQTKNRANDERPKKLMVSGLVHLEKEDSVPVAVKRGMTILSRDGQEVGQVAALVVAGEGQTVTQLLLTRLRPSPEYRLVPLSLIKQVNEEAVSLDLSRQAVESLPLWQATRPSLTDSISLKGVSMMRSQLTINTQAETQLEKREWAKIGLTTAIVSVVAVLVVQALAIAIWPEIAQFKPLDSYLRSALFTLVPVAGATGLLAWLVGHKAQPIQMFIKISALVLLVSIIPDYLVPDPHKTLLASSVTAFLHVAAAVVTVPMLVVGYQRRKGRR